MADVEERLRRYAVALDLADHNPLPGSLAPAVDEEEVPTGRRLLAMAAALLVVVGVVLAARSAERPAVTAAAREAPGSAIPRLVVPQGSLARTFPFDGWAEPPALAGFQEYQVAGINGQPVHFSWSGYTQRATAKGSRIMTIDVVVMGGMLGDLGFPGLAPGCEARTIGVRGHKTGLLLSDDSQYVVTWQEGPDVVALLRVIGYGEAETLSIVEQLESISDEAWATLRSNAAAVTDASSRDANWRHWVRGALRSADTTGPPTTGATVGICP